jgi:hypothetical protein
VNRRLVLVGLIIFGQSDGHGVTLGDLSTEKGEAQGLFINGLPVATFELKNSLTKQTVADAVEQYRRDRDPREPLFAFGRCVVHFAVDDSEVRMCPELKGKGS